MSLRTVTAGDAVKRLTNVVAASSNYTCCFWWRYTGAEANRQQFLTIDDPLIYADLASLNAFITPPYQTAGYVGLAAAYTNLTPFTDIVQNRFYHLAYRRAASTQQYYINGRLIGSATVNLITATFGEIWLGDDSYGNAAEAEFQYFREWDTGLTANEINLERLSAIVVKTANLVTDTPLVSDLLDISGNGNHWTAVGSPIFVDTFQMPTRLYPCLTPPNAVIHGPAQGTWERQGYLNQSWSPVQWTWSLEASKVNGGEIRTTDLKTNQQGDFDGLLYRALSRPLEAQTIEGTFDLCFMRNCAWLDAVLNPANSSVVQLKISIYITIGQTHQVRAWLLQDYVDTTNFTFNGLAGTTLTAAALAAVQELTPGMTQAGDCICIEWGPRVVSSPTPAATYPPTNMTRINMRTVGTSSAAATVFDDMIPGDTSNSRSPWVEFSQALSFRAAPPTPVNGTCATAIIIPGGATSYDSGNIDASQSTDTDRRVWWQWTAPADMVVCFHAKGSNYGGTVQVWKGAGCGSLSIALGEQIESSGALSQHRSQSHVVMNAVSGRTYWISIKATAAAGTQAPQGAGVARLGMFVRQSVPLADDLFFPAGSIAQYREGQLVNITNAFFAFAPTGIAIDYTQRPMDSLAGGVNAAMRLLVGLFTDNLVEILDLSTLSIGEAEVDFIADGWGLASVQSPAQIYVTAAGHLYTAFFGNGFLYVIGVGGTPTIMNTVSDVAAKSAVRNIDAIEGDNQPGAPFAAVAQLPTPQVTSPWAFTIDEATGTLYYTSGGFYEPVGGTEIRTFNIGTGLDGPVFATLALNGTNNPGLKGLRFLPGGGILVCNGTTIQRLSAAGAVQWTYTPSVPGDAQTLTDVQLSADGLYFYTVDLTTARIFKGRMVDGVEVFTWETFLVTGTLIQMAIYQPSGAAVPPTPGGGGGGGEPGENVPQDGCPAPALAPVTPQPACVAPTPTVI